MEPGATRLTDAALIRQTLAGQTSAFDVLVQRYRGIVYTVSRRLLHDEHLAWDATQEAFLAAYRGLGALRRPDRFGPWLKRIARRSCSRLRQATSRVETADPGLLERLPLTEAADEEAGSELVSRALARLSPTGRRAAELHYFDGLSCEEVAVFLGLSVGGVKTRLHRTREMLRKELTRMGTPGSHKLVIGYVQHWGQGAENLFYEAQSKELYAELYPRGSLADEPWRDLDMSRGEGLAQTARWEALGVVRRRGNAVTCLMPVITDEDEAVMRPWREEVATRAEPVLQRGVPEIRAAVEQVPGAQRDFDNVFSILLQVHTLHWSAPLGRLLGGIVGPYPERGHGARYWCSGEARTRIPPLSGLRNRGGQGREWRMGILNVGERYPRFDALLDKWGRYFSGSQPALLATIGERGIGEGNLPLVLRAAGYDVADAEQLLADLVQTKLIKRVGRRWRLAIPVFHERDLAPIEAACSRLAEGIVEAFQAAMPDYEKRVAKCSFRKCAFADVTTRMFGDAEGTVVHRMIQLGLLPAPPEEPSGDWGVFLVLQ
jgi:RNA polymerase sigma-70 factor (ECF subfamily)